MSSPHKHATPSSLNEYEVLPNGCEAHWEVVERILFIYAKLNPGIAYVQGMNEIVGPLYYTFATDPNSEWKGKRALGRPHPCPGSLESQAVGFRQPQLTASLWASISLCRMRAWPGASQIQPSSDLLEDWKCTELLIFVTDYRIGGVSCDTGS